MTNGQWLIKQIIEKKKLIQVVEQEIEEFESDLSGMEIDYHGMYAVIEGVDIDGEVILYVEEDDGNSYNLMLSIYELLELI
jgi:hypothetical protein